MLREKGLSNFLEKHEKKKTVSFHMPGHKGMGIYEKFGYKDCFRDIANKDITEIKGADNLFQAEGVIKEVQEKYKKLYEVKASYILVNGSSSGIIAAILASVEKGKKLLVARNCHKSIFSAISLGGIIPVYIQSEFIEEYGIMGEINPSKIENALEKDKDIQAVILPSPNYYGVLSDVKKIKEITLKYGVKLIIDQAHGAHLKFLDPSKSAEEQGGDIVINSTHKTLASLTQTAILNVNSNVVDLNNLEEKLQWMQTTSPSYILMESLDINADLLLNHGDELFREWKEGLHWFYEEIKGIEGIKVVREDDFTRIKLDETKINIDLGIPGDVLEEALINVNIYPELYTGNILMFMTGIGTKKEDLEKLLFEIKKIINQNKFCSKASKRVANSQKECERNGENNFPENEFVGIGKNRELVDFVKAEGRVAAGSIIPYPPGIPLICPGERITKDNILRSLALRKKGEKVIGINKNEEVFVYVD